VIAACRAAIWVRPRTDRILNLGFDQPTMSTLLAPVWLSTWFTSLASCPADAAISPVA
jgi:hypothetical protein